MRTRRRSSGSKRTRALPASSRVTRRRAVTSLPRPLDLAAALRSSREALLDIEGQLDALLAVLRDPTAAPDATAPDRLRGAAREAGTALASLIALAR
ncbi:MAG TPA: hypothetical protein VFH68_09620 [Polyangia bacterium]|nr:hypothetical protein [Polyangia bacterium]